MYFWLPDRVDTMRVTRNIALQTKNKFEGLGDIIHRVRLVTCDTGIPVSQAELWAKKLHLLLLNPS
jgi:hypothetical protein